MKWIAALIVTAALVAALGAFGYVADREKKHGVVLNEMQTKAPRIDGEEVACQEAADSVNSIHIKNVAKINADLRAGGIPTDVYKQRMKVEGDDYAERLKAAKETCGSTGPTSSSAGSAPEPAKQHEPSKFRILLSDPVAGVYEFELDPTEAKRELPIKVDAPDDVFESWGSGQMCALSHADGKPCNGPNGQQNRPNDVAKALWAAGNLADFPVSTAMYNSLVLYRGADEGIQIGEYAEWSAGKGPVYAGVNSRQSEMEFNKEGFVIRIQRKKK